MVLPVRGVMTLCPPTVVRVAGWLPSLNVRPLLPAVRRRRVIMFFTSVLWLGQCCVSFVLVFLQVFLCIGFMFGCASPLVRTSISLFGVWSVLLPCLPCGRAAVVFGFWCRMVSLLL